MNARIEKLVKMACKQHGSHAVQIHDGQDWRTIGWYGNRQFAESQMEKAARTFNTECVRVVG